MFTVKATYCGETRKFHFSDTSSLPSFVDLYAQLYRAFPHLGHRYSLCQLLFSPNSSNTRILVAKEVHNAEQYKRAIANPGLAGPWPNPTLKFDVVDETLPALRRLQPPADPWSSHPTWRTPPALEPPSLPAPNQFTSEPFSGLVPPPPIIFSSPPSQKPLPPWTPPQPLAPCCAVDEAKQDIRSVIDDFKKDLDSIMQSLGPKEPLHPCCARCSRLFSGPWFSCTSCHTILCSSCRWQIPLTCDTSGLPHVWTLNQRPKLGAYQHPSFGFNRQPLPFMPPPPPFMPPPPPFMHPPPPFMPRPPPPPPPPPPVIPRMNGWDPSWQPSTEPPTEPPQVPPKVVHQGVLCDACDATIEGVRHKCLDCPDYDLCSKCIGQGAAERHDPFHEFLDLHEPGRVVVHVVGDRGSASPQPGPVQTTAAPTLHSANCDLCDSRIRGDRYKCVQCPDFDVCGICFSITSEQHPRHSFVKLSTTDQYISRHGAIQPRHNASCNSCLKTIEGARYKCMHPTCPDFDLCDRCEALPISVHPDNHPLLKMKAPDTVIPTVYRVGTTTLIDAEDRDLCPSRMSTPFSCKTDSRSRSPDALPWFYGRAEPRNPQFLLDLKPRSPPMSAPSPLQTISPLSPSPPPLPPKFMPFSSDFAWWPQPNMAVPPAPPAGAYQPRYIDVSPQDSFVNPPASSYKPVYMNPYLDEAAPPPAPEVPSFYRHDWSTRSGTASPVFSAHSPVCTASSLADDLVGRAIVQYPAVAPNSSWHNPFQRRLSSDTEQNQDLILPEAPKFVPFTRFNVPASVKITIPETVKPMTPPHPNAFPDLVSLMTPQAPSPVQEETFLTPISENTHLPLPEPEINIQSISPSMGSSTTFRSHTLAELLNEFPPRSRFSVSDVSRDQSSEASVFDTPLPEVFSASTTFVEPVHDQSMVKNWRNVIELPFAADFIEDVTVADGQVFPPGAEFVKSWRVKNTGKDWDESTELVFVTGESFSQNEVPIAISVGALKNGKEIDLYTGDLKAPDAPGRYIGYWRLKNSTCHLFGASIWIDITVAEHSHVSSDESSAPSSMSSSSVIVMPSAPDMTKQMQHLSLSTTAAVTAASGSTVSDVFSLDGSEDSFSGASLVSTPSSDDWEDSRVNAASVVAATPRSNALDYVVLYDDNSSEEDI